MKNKKEYFQLDGGGIIYPYIASDDWNQQFRTEVELDAPVDIARLRRALEIVRPRFPSFFVVLAKRGREYVLERTEKLPEIVPETGLCKPFDLTNRDHALFRLTYAENRLGMEVFHSLADGAGANVLCINLLAEYYALTGEPVDRAHPVFAHGGEYEAADTEDSFRRVHNELGGRTQKRTETKAYQYNGGRAEIPLRLTVFDLPVPELKNAAKACGASITVFLVAVYTKALARACLADGKRANSRNIKIEVPMDMRKRFGSETLRNFSLYFNTEAPADCAEKPLPEIVELLKPQFAAGTDVGKLQNDIYTNVSQEELPIFKLLPIGLKRKFLRFGNIMFGERLFTSPFSNVGIFDLPPELVGHVRVVNMMISKTRLNTLYSTTLSYRGNLAWSLTSVAAKHDAEDFVAEILTEAGVPFGRTER